MIIMPKLHGNEKLTRIHVNQHNIKANNKDGKDRPVITVKDYKQNRYGHEVFIKDDKGSILAKVVYPSKGLNCGARVWIETKCKVEVRER